MKKLIKGIGAVISFSLCITGIILLMCEAPEIDAQVNTGILGITMFLVGVLPAIFATRRGNNDEYVYLSEE